MKEQTEKKVLLHEDEIPIKKVMRGFDPDEVVAYIDEMNRTMENSSKNFELRMAEMKQELTLANRERDIIAAKLAEKEKNDDRLSSGRENELLGRIAELENMLETRRGEDDAYVSEENAIIASELADREEELKTAFEKIALLEKKCDNNPDVKNAEESSRKLAELSELLARAQSDLGLERERTQTLCEKLEEKTASADSYYRQLSEIQEKYDILFAESLAADEQLKRADAEKAELKSECEKLKIENSLLSEKNGRYVAELASLKADIKTAAYENAEKITAEIEELDREKLKLRRTAQLQEYHIGLAKNAIAELGTQLEEIARAFADTGRE